jgi:putative endonuclease
MTPYYVYIILCEGDSFYTGSTKNVKSRFRLHLNGKGARYTKMHRPKSLVYVEEFASRPEAMKREKRIKRLSHVQKARLQNHTSSKIRKGRKEQARIRGRRSLSSPAPMPAILDKRLSQAMHHAHAVLPTRILFPRLATRNADRHRPVSTG